MWEQVCDDEGRFYNWNTETDEVKWDLEPKLKTKEKTYVKTDTCVKEDKVKLQLIVCQPKDKIINRVWSQLSNKQREINELEVIYRNNIFCRLYKMFYYLLKTRYFETWKNSIHYIRINELCSTLLFLTRWKETLKYKETFCFTLKKITCDYKVVVKELAIAKQKLAEENYSKLCK
jgi:hypothetical protein